MKTETGKLISRKHFQVVSYCGTSCTAHSVKGNILLAQRLSFQNKYNCCCPITILSCLISGSDILVFLFSLKIHKQYLLGDYWFDMILICLSCRPKLKYFLMPCLRPFIEAVLIRDTNELLMSCNNCFIISTISSLYWFPINSWGELSTERSLSTEHALIEVPSTVPVE
jgi:hypothetical protein